MLNVAVGIAAGVRALVPAVPALHGHVPALCPIILVLLTLVNLRGIEEAGAAFILPTYLLVGTLALTLIIGLVRAALSGGHPHPLQAPPAAPVATAGESCPSGTMGHEHGGVDMRA